MKNNKDCSFVRNHLFAYLERDLSDEEVEAVTDHLHSCEECSRVLDEFRSVTRLISVIRDEEPDPFAGTRIIQKLETRLQRGQGSTPLFQKILQPVLLSLLLLLGAVTGVAIVKQQEARRSETLAHQQDIQAMQAGLNIPDFIDEGILVFNSHSNRTP